MARPQKQIDFEMLDNLIGIFCTGEECASVLGVDYDTLNSKIKKKYKMGFSEFFKKKNNVGKAALRRRQFELSKNNVAMAIWLGKQYLDQCERTEIEQTIHREIVIVRAAIPAEDERIKIERVKNPVAAISG